jgi:hypothetical protein
MLLACGLQIAYHCIGLQNKPGEQEDEREQNKTYRQ